MVIRVPSSKTSISGFSVTVGCSGTEVCAYCSLSLYLRSRKASPDAPLFLFHNDAPVTHRLLSFRMKQIFEAAGLSADKISLPHSLRAGVATDAAALQLPEPVIKRLGRWKSEAYKLYIRPSDAQTASLAALFASGLRPLFTAPIILIVLEFKTCEIFDKI